MKRISFKLVWFDSLGAKSSCVLVRTPDVGILIDPGVAVMQPSFPATEEEKNRWEKQGWRKIKRASRQADIVVVSHYHYDHFTDFDRELYENKLVFAKNPNQYINDSQRARAENFYGSICQEFGGVELSSVLKEWAPGGFADIFDDLVLAKRHDFGDYAGRRRELLSKGKKWFLGRAKHWRENKEIPEFKFSSVQVIWADGREFEFGKTKLRFTNPLFHGVEYSRVGWLFATVIEYSEEKLLHSSDLSGPVIEDYAEWIIHENPQILILDGPMTYMFGYMVNRINLNRAVANAVRIVKEADVQTLIYDHHLLREPNFREFTRPVWQVGERCGKMVTTAAEFLGKQPKILEAAGKV